MVRFVVRDCGFLWILIFYLPLSVKSFMTVIPPSYCYTSRCLPGFQVIDFDMRAPYVPMNGEYDLDLQLPCPCSLLTMSDDVDPL